MRKSHSPLFLLGFLALAVFAAAEEYSTLSDQEAEMISRNSADRSWQASPSRMEVDIRAGYATPDFRELKTALDGFVDYEDAYFFNYLFLTGSAGSTSRKKHSNVSGGFSAQAGGFLDLNPYFGLGLSLGYFSPGKLSSEIEDTGAYGETVFYNLSVETSIFTLLGGLQFHSLRPVPGLSWSARILAGPVFANGTVTSEFHFTDPYYGIDLPYNYSIPLSGIGLYADFDLAVEYRLTESFALAAGGGYHYCVVSQMKSTVNADPNQDGYYEITSGSTFSDLDGKDIPFNFSGLDIHGGVKIYY